LSDELVVVDTVGTEFEADAVCGLLRDAGIECMHRGATMSAGILGGVGQGASEVLVRAADEERAREALAARDET
jgi:putative signal transducing protein